MIGDFSNPLSGNLCVLCLPDICQCVPLDELVSCEDCLVLYPEDEARSCGSCGMVLCTYCIETSGVCCGASDE